jgi:hypothetical protein
MFWRGPSFRPSRLSGLAGAALALGELRRRGRDTAAGARTFSRLFDPTDSTLAYFSKTRN